MLKLRSATILLLALARVGWASEQPLQVDARPTPPYRRHPLKLPPGGRTGFTRLPPETTGVFFTNQVSSAGLARNQILEIGAGVALGDVDGDGGVDLFFCSLESTNRLYRNLGNWAFADVTAEAGVGRVGTYSTGAVFADVDGDGDLDLLVNSLRGGTRLLTNDGHGHFTEAIASGLTHPHGSTTLALADIDGDRWLDLYVATYRTNTIKDSLRDLDIRVSPVDGRLVVSPPGRFVPLALKNGGVSLLEVGEPDLLFRNLAGRRFERVSWTDGAFLDAAGRPLPAAPLGWGLTVSFRDLNGDRAPDIYVCNDFFQSLDEVWLNDGSGRFRPAGPVALRHTSMSSMAVDFADLNRDGFDDFLVTDMLSREHQQRHRQRGSQVHLQMDLPLRHPLYRPEYPRNMLFLNRGDGTYAEIAQFSGLEATEWTWSVVLLDVDLDGYEDALITTGNLRDANDADLSQGRVSTMESRYGGNLRFPRLATPDLAYRNQHDLTFKECGEEWGFCTVGVSQAIAVADLDNDGDLDLVALTYDQPAGLFRNNSVAPRLAVRLRGTPPNTQGIGAKIVVRGGAADLQSQEVVCGGRYLSGDDPLRVFAAGTPANGLTIEVAWRGGQRTLIPDALPNHVYEVFESGLAAPPPPTNNASTTTPSEAMVTTASLAAPDSAKPRANGVRFPLFSDVSTALRQPHQDPPFDDFERQPGLPRLLSRLGPGVTWYDVDGNGAEDLLLGSGRSGYQVLYLNDGRGGFRALHPKDKATGDQTATLAWRHGTSHARLLVGTSHYEAEPATDSTVVEQDPQTGALRPLVALPAGVGPLALGVLGGQPVLFVGGRMRPGRYPEAASSLLLVCRDGQWETDAPNTARLNDIGLVSGAVWSDLDGDAELDLVLACDWGPMRIFRGEGGVLRPWNVPVRRADPAATRGPATDAARSPSHLEPDPSPRPSPIGWERVAKPGEGERSMPTEPSRRAKPGSQDSDINHELSTLNQLTGWWNGVATGDFDGDGRLDLIASNWGRNTGYQRHRAHPLRVYFGDWSETGGVNLLEAYFEESLGKYTPFQPLDRLRLTIPALASRFASFADYARASIEDVLGEAAGAASHWEADWLESTVFLNRGDHFEARPLPDEAQFAPAFGVSIGDLDGDGREDVVLSQNFFGVEGETSRHDAGRGLLLRGDGQGGFEALRGQESGLRLEGEQRGCALADFDQDGRYDLAIGQNDGPTGLFRNVGGRPGLRVRLRGPPTNPDGFGALLRLKYGDRFGPARLVQAGSGYWSQESAVQVLGLAGVPSAIWVRWPGGATSLEPVSTNAREVSVRAPDR